MGLLDTLRGVWTSNPSRIDLMHYCDNAGDAIERLTTSLRETTAEAEEHRKNIIECHTADPNYAANEQYRQAYDQELARMDGMIERAKKALSS